MVILWGFVNNYCATLYIIEVIHAVHEQDSTSNCFACDLGLVLSDLLLGYFSLYLSAIGKHSVHQCVVWNPVWRVLEGRLNCMTSLTAATSGPKKSIRMWMWTKSSYRREVSVRLRVSQSAKMRCFRPRSSQPAAKVDNTAVVVEKRQESQSQQVGRDVKENGEAGAHQGLKTLLSR